MISSYYFIIEHGKKQSYKPVSFTTATYFNVESTLPETGYEGWALGQWLYHCDLSMYADILHLIHLEL